MYYQNNKNLKAAGVTVDFTQEQLNEYIKCYNDPVYFTETYVQIVHVDRGLINFNLWPFQKTMIQNFHDNRFNIVKIPRQSGKCFLGSTKYTVRNKSTGEILELTAEEFHNKIKI